MTTKETFTAVASKEELRRVFDLQRAHRWSAKNSTAEERIEALLRLRSVVERRADDARDALHADLGKPAEEPMMLEVATVLHDIDVAVEHLASWMKPDEIIPTPGAGHDEAVIRIEYEARGVCLLFGPWNFPFQLVLAPLVPIIAAGNTAMVKPNELAPATSRLVASILEEAFEERHVAVFQGSVDLANELLELPVDHIFFTGSPAVGRIVMTAAAKHLATVTLELGGKCPAIIDGTADLAAAAAAVGAGKSYNSGQICLSPDYVLIKRELRDEFLTLYFEWVRDNLYINGEFNPHAMSRMIDDRNLERVSSYVDDAVTKGAEIRGNWSVDRRARILEPIALLDVPEDAAILREEIFGPVLPVLTFDEVESVVDTVRSGGKPLAMYVFSEDSDFVSSVLAGTSSGGVTVNGWATHFQEFQIPFGGVGSSGMGSYHGVHGFKALSHARSVLKQR